VTSNVARTPFVGPRLLSGGAKRPQSEKDGVPYASFPLDSWDTSLAFADGSKPDSERKTDLLKNKRGVSCITVGKSPCVKQRAGPMAQAFSQQLGRNDSSDFAASTEVVIGNHHSDPG